MLVPGQAVLLLQTDITARAVMETRMAALTESQVGEQGLEHVVQLPLLSNRTLQFPTIICLSPLHLTSW